MEDRKSATFKELWQQYSQGIVFYFRWWKGIAVAKKALQSGKSRETIIGILQFDPNYQDLINREGIEAAQDYAELTFLAALRVQDSGRWQLISMILNRRQFSSSAQIHDLGMLDTDYVLLVAEQEQSAVRLKNLIKTLVKLLTAIAIVYILTYLVIFSPHWRGIWSVYTSQISHQTLLVCRYCSIDSSSIILVKNPNLTLKQVIGQPTDPVRPIRLAVKDYPNTSLTSNSWSVISGETLQGRVLFF
jgi:hypothetical protein